MISEITHALAEAERLEAVHIELRDGSYAQTHSPGKDFAIELPLRKAANCRADAARYAQLLAAGYIPPSLQRFVENPRKYTRYLMTDWWMPVEDYVAMAMQESSMAGEPSNGETNYRRYTADGENPPPFDLPDGYEWDEEESWDYWRIRIIAK
jgi:hypothetical protein